ncbi:phenylacetic acid degradation protein [Alicyclobacillus fastidiosus]|uniref:Phenylacetic acid degradation protein n=1 Tax=Alicyclobacillus fastidiosus TaxID=392011 RepID=A0ABY6ZA02_9BACL|nr:phenylacetic acid degradation protein [Alicyclobacillus fastidiosus]WAH39709.1 phenylacetic acid degradation protein [Alicyclobacillus fastidiosus]GMA60932.1 hypothetical protein GCM10025859_13720 [Alicyclobacillus fastidiosus]
MTEDDTRHCYVPYEVFIQKSKLDYHVHVGSVLAPSPELALQLARENFLRRDTAVNIWVVRQSDIHQTPSEDHAFFAREFTRSYREVTGYSDNARRWKAFKERRAQRDQG